MKPILFTLLLACTALAGDLPTFLSTPRGFTYTDVKVLSSTKDSITISYSGGTATLAIADLPQVWREHFKMVDPSAPAAGAALPAPMEGAKVYSAAEIKPHQAELKGKVVPMRLAHDSATSIEAQDDGSFIMFVLCKEGAEFVVLPIEGAAPIKAILKTKPGEIACYGLVRLDQPTLILGREYDAQKKAYVW